MESVVKGAWFMNVKMAFPHLGYPQPIVKNCTFNCAVLCHSIGNNRPPFGVFGGYKIKPNQLKTQFVIRRKMTGSSTF